tara:strand:+ start:422 stop:1612 length:1191 start_codon:yes stop_codon:yes gene_type:complete
MDIKCYIKKEDFPATINYIYLNAANVSSPYKYANEAINKWQNDLLYNGSVNFNDNAEENVFKPLQKATAQLLNCDSDEICCGSSATELLSTVAWGIAPKKYQNIVSCEASFPSTVYPWHRICEEYKCELRLAKYDDKSYTNIDNIINLIDENTTVVTVSHIEFTNGQIYNLKKLANEIHKYNGYLIVDGSQSIGAIPIDVKECGVDIIVTGSYKWLCSTFGASIMYINKNIINKINPGLYGFRSHKDMWDLQANRLKLKTTADKFSFSTLHFGSIYGLTKSVELINNIGINNIYQYNLILTNYLIKQLKKITNINIISPINNIEEYCSIITFSIYDIPTKYIIEKLTEKKIIVSNRNNYIRISTHFYNTIEDINYTCIVLNEIICSYRFNLKKSKL